MNVIHKTNRSKSHAAFGEAGGWGAGGGNISGAKSFFSFIFTLTFPSPFLLTFTTTTTAEFQDETKRKWAKMGQKRE